MLFFADAFRELCGIEHFADGNLVRKLRWYQLVLGVPLRVVQNQVWRGSTSVETEGMVYYVVVQKELFVQASV